MQRDAIDLKKIFFEVFEDPQSRGHTAGQEAARESGRSSLCCGFCRKEREAGGQPEDQGRAV